MEVLDSAEINLMESEIMLNAGRRLSSPHGDREARGDHGYLRKRGVLNNRTGRLPYRYAQVLLAAGLILFAAARLNAEGDEGEGQPTRSDTASTLEAPAPSVSAATEADELELLEGFSSDLVYRVPRDQGSWVSLAVDPRGRLLACDQYGKIYRLTLSDGAGEPAQVEPIELEIGFAHGLLCAFDSLYVVAHAHNDKPAGLYRVRDTNGDDEYDRVKLLRAFQGGGEHGPHAVIPSPDGKSLYVCGGNHTKIPNPETSRVPRNWQEDQVMPRLWDAGGHAVGITAPGGWICQTDPEGKSFELVSIGYRNQFDIAFNSAGDLFTYDADMEWDIGTTWYRPTRVCHATSGSEFGWRSGTGKWPTYYQDSLPAVVDIGPGSPTGIVFGHDARFPAKYQRALFIADWSYGVIYAVHLKQQGATYTAEFERFCAAPALPVADIVTNPVDGNMYFVVGGRRTQSGLYRISYTGEKSIEEPAPIELNQAHRTRRELEKWHSAESPPQVDQAKLAKEVVSHLASPHRFIRYAARIAMEHQPVDRWRESALNSEEPIARIEAVTALARTGTPDDLTAALECLASIDWKQLDQQQRLQLLRSYGLVRIRLDESGETTRQAINERFSPLYPADSILLNRELSRLLSATEPEGFVDRTIELLFDSQSQQEQIHYALCLSHVTEGWTPSVRRAYFEWFFDAASIRGGNSLRGYLNNIRREAIKRLDEQTRQALGELVTRTPQIEDPYKELKAKPFVNDWTVDELLNEIEGTLDEADVENGRRIFSLAQCYACHRFEGEGGIVGPDLTPAAHRYSLRDLLITLIEPNRAVSDQYRATRFLLDNGQVVVGRVVNLSGDTYRVQTDMINPSSLTSVNRNRIDLMEESEVSMMPEGLLDNLTAEEIRDLIGYLKSSTASVPGGTSGQSEQRE